MWNHVFAETYRVNDTTVLNKVDSFAAVEHRCTITNNDNEEATEKLTSTGLGVVLQQ